MLFALSMIPYLTRFLAMNFYEFVPQFLYGMNFIVVEMLAIAVGHFIKKADGSNDNLHMSFKNYYPYISAMIIVAVGIILGYFIYPPIIVIFCLLSIAASWCMTLKDDGI